MVVAAHFLPFEVFPISEVLAITVLYLSRDRLLQMRFTSESIA